MNTRPTLIITGFGLGFGEALSDFFTSKGYQVVGLSRQPLSNEYLSQKGDTFKHYAVDLTDEAASTETLKKVVTDCGKPSVWIHNAALLNISPFESLSSESFKTSWETTCFSAMLGGQVIIPSMLENGGSIIFTGATASIKGGQNFAAFASAKFALRGLAQSLAREYGSKGIHVAHTIMDGLIWGPQTQERFSPDEAVCMQAEDVAQAYYELAHQKQSAWTHEMDLRPYLENF